MTRSCDRAASARVHRPPTVRDADTIIVLRRGRIAEQGTRDQLLVAAGAYAALAGSDVSA